MNRSRRLLGALVCGALFVLPLGSFAGVTLAQGTTPLQQVSPNPDDAEPPTEDMPPAADATETPTPTATVTPTPTATATPTVTSTPTVTPTATATPGLSSVTLTIADPATTAALQNAVRASLDQQADAIAKRDTSVVLPTSTSDYYLYLTQTLRQSLDQQHVTSMRLTNVRWTAFAVGGRWATVSDRETWLTTFANGSTNLGIGRWIYTLVNDNGTWKVHIATPVLTDE